MTAQPVGIANIARRIFPAIRVGRWVAGLGLMAAAAWAQTAKIGDLDADGQATIHDVAAILNHVHGRVPLPAALVYFADIDRNGIVNIADADLAADAAVGGLPLADVDVRPVLPAFVPYTNRDHFTFQGRALPNARIRVSHVFGSVETQADGRGFFAAEAPLTANQSQQFYLAVLDAPHPPLPFRVWQDVQGPTLQVSAPQNGGETFLSEIAVAGKVGDALNGRHGVSVSVNHMPAEVFAGNGSRGSFLSRPVPLREGANIIPIQAVDAAGNETTIKLSITRRRAAGSFHLLKGFGDLQQEQPGSRLKTPASVFVLSPDGRPIAGKPVLFQVLDGLGKIALTADFAEPGLRLSVMTDSRGRAQVHWQLGAFAGKGNHLLKAESRGIKGQIYFAASALPTDNIRLDYASGDGQTAETGATAPEPLRVWVNDGVNPLSRREVTFNVLAGGGNIGGQKSYSAISDATGFAEARFVLGPEAGTHTVAANVPGRAAANLKFALHGLASRPTGETTVRGLALTPFFQPIAGAKVGIIIEGKSFEPVNTDAAGSFWLTGLSPGAAMLQFWLPEGSASQAVPSQPIATKELFLIRGVENQLPAPILLPLTLNRLTTLFDGTSSVELFLLEMDAFRLEIVPGTVVAADGKAPSPESPLTFSLTQIPAHGQSFIAWLLEPADVQFLSPPKLRIPDLAGMAGDFTMGVFHSGGRIRPFNRSATAGAKGNPANFSFGQEDTPPFQAGFGFASPGHQSGNATATGGQSSEPSQ